MNTRLPRTDRRWPVDTDESDVRLPQAPARSAPNPIVKDRRFIDDLSARRWLRVRREELRKIILQRVPSGHNSSSMPFRSESVGAAVAIGAYVLLGKYPPNSSSVPRAAATTRMFFITTTGPFLQAPIDHPIRPPVRRQRRDHRERHSPDQQSAASQGSGDVATVGRARRSRSIGLIERVRQRAQAESDEHRL
jgi:hypothetical protein